MTGVGQSTSALSTSSRPFTVLHVCLGNICRSPMAERLLAGRFEGRVVELGHGIDATTLLRSHSAGTGDWHVGEPMNPGSAAQLAARNVSSSGFHARTLDASQLSSTDLVLTATTRQVEAVRYIAPSLSGRVFPLLWFGRVARELRPAAIAELPAFEPTPSAVRARGEALVAAVAQQGGPGDSDPTDDLTDPWGACADTFRRVADEIDHALEPLIAGLTGTEIPTHRRDRNSQDVAT